MPSKNCPTAYLPLKERLVSLLVEIKKLQVSQVQSLGSCLV